MTSVTSPPKKLRKPSPLERGFEAVSKLDSRQGSKIDKAFEEKRIVTKNALLPMRPAKKLH